MEKHNEYPNNCQIKTEKELEEELGIYLTTYRKGHPEKIDLFNLLEERYPFT